VSPAAAGCTRYIHPSCAIKRRLAFPDLADNEHYRILCSQHGDPCLYCTCRAPYDPKNRKPMTECSRCKVGRRAEGWEFVEGPAMADK
jgi:hypothetical protein